jgi:inositol-1,3,4-trisphosphate 5/6-kinase/inositol-tetrakisphosphate 1-kinase
MVKWERMNWKKFVDYCATKGVEVFYLDLTLPIDAQGPVSVIIHKMTFVMKGHDMAVDPALRALYEFSEAHPEVPIVDDLNAVAVTLDREEMTRIFESIQWPTDLPVFLPRTAVLVDSSPATIAQTVAAAKLRFPLLAKPKVATATTESHMLRLVTVSEQLVGVPTPTMLQEFVNHDGVVFKMYALRDHLEAGARASMRNIEPGEDLRIDFHSQHSEVDNGLWVRRRDFDDVKIPIEDFARISEILRAAFNLNLIGFDILIDHQKRYWLVDLNFFPGYKNIEDLWGKFLQFFTDIINGK